MGVSRAKLLKTFNNAVAKFDELRTTITYRVVTPGVYDPVTDTTTNVTSDLTIENAILTGLSTTEYGWFPTDRVTQKLIIPALAFGTVVPNETDSVIIGGLNWEIVKIKTAPAALLHVIYVELT